MGTHLLLKLFGITALTITQACNVVEIRQAQGDYAPNENTLAANQAVSPDEAIQDGTPASNARDYSPFPLPDDASNIAEPEPGIDVAFQTNMDQAQTISFFQDEFARQGISQLNELTSISDLTFSIYFGPTADGQNIHVQAISMAKKTYVNIRYESPF